MQHLESLIEDRSYSSLERAKFKGWHSKWTKARIPLLACLSIETLSPAKLLSKTFQSEDVDAVTTSSLLEQTRQQLARIERKDFFELPTVKRFLDKVKKDDNDDQYYFQDVILKDFVNAKESVSRKKNDWVTLISEALETRLASDESVSSKHGVSIINTEGWARSENNLEFCDDAITSLYAFYEKPLNSAGFNGSISDLLEQWHNLVTYTVKYLEPQKTDYRKVWHMIYNSSRRKDWNLVLLLVELLFVLPVSNAKVERLFSLMNRIKTDCRASLSADRLSSLIRICMEGPQPADFNPVSSMQLWVNGVQMRRPNQKKRQSYNQRALKERAKTLIDLSETDSDSSDSDELDLDV